MLPSPLNSSFSPGLTAARGRDAWSSRRGECGEDRRADAREHVRRGSAIPAR